MKTQHGPWFMAVFYVMEITSFQAFGIGLGTHGAMNDGWHSDMRGLKITPHPIRHTLSVSKDNRVPSEERGLTKGLSRLR